MPYYVYILQCSDSSLYTGVTTDLQRRLFEHNNTGKGAKYTKIRRPVILVYNKKCENRSMALKCEYAIKKLTRSKKLKLINGE